MDQSVTDTNGPNKFDPSKLPTDLLDQLHLIAESKGKDELCKAIEEEMFGRVMERVKEQDQIKRWYEWEKEKVQP